MPSDEVKMLYAGAVAYADAALLIFDNSKAEGRDALVLPIHTLIGLSVEMLFKAVFLAKGGDAKQLKNIGVRHNLKELRKLAYEEGFTSAVSAIEEIVNHIGDNYAAHEYRYMKPNSLLNKVNVGLAIPAIQSFIDEVAGEIALPLRPSSSTIGGA